MNFDIFKGTLLQASANLGRIMWIMKMKHWLLEPLFVLTTQIFIYIRLLVMLKSLFWVTIIFFCFFLIVITLSWNAITCFLESSWVWDRFLLFRVEIMFPLQLQICFILLYNQMIKMNNQIIRTNNQIFKILIVYIRQGWQTSVVTCLLTMPIHISFTVSVIYFARARYSTMYSLGVWAEFCPWPWAI